MLRIRITLCLAFAAIHSPSASAQEPVPVGLEASDWAGIRAAYDAGRHAASEVEDGYQARNPGQRWTTEFDGAGFLVEPDNGGWTWGLQLHAFGFEGAMQVVEAAAEAKLPEL